MSKFYSRQKIVPAGNKITDTRIAYLALCTAVRLLMRLRLATRIGQVFDPGRPAEVTDPKRFLICPPTGLGPPRPLPISPCLALSQRRFFANSFFLRANIV